MTDGPRQRGSAAPSTSEDAAADTGNAAGQSSVALKKEIGLVSACGIIVGECSVVPLNIFIGVFNRCTVKHALDWIMLNETEIFQSAHTNQSYEMENRSFTLGKLYMNEYRLYSIYI